MSHAHLRLHCLEIIGLAGLSLSAHTLSGPLFKPTDPLVHVHVLKNNRNQRLWTKIEIKGNSDEVECQGERREVGNGQIKSHPCARNYD